MPSSAFRSAAARSGHNQIKIVCSQIFQNPFCRHLHSIQQLLVLVSNSGMYSEPPSPESKLELVYCQRQITVANCAPSLRPLNLGKWLQKNRKMLVHSGIFQGNGKLQARDRNIRNAILLRANFTFEMHILCIICTIAGTFPKNTCLFKRFLCQWFSRRIVS